MFTVGQSVYVHPLHSKGVLEKYGKVTTIGPKWITVTSNRGIAKRYSAENLAHIQKVMKGQ